MKKLFLIILTLLFAFNYTGFSIELSNENPLDLPEEHYEFMYKYTISNSAYMLEQLGIANKSKKEIGWEPIDRRNAFEMLYLAYTCLVGYDDSTDNIQPLLEGRRGGVDWFADAPVGTYDNFLACNLVMERLANGKGRTEEGKLIMDFDSELTYYEALTAITNMFTMGYENYEHWYSKKTVFSEVMSNSKYPRYEFAKLIGLINQDATIHYSPLEIKEDVLDKPISAYEYMHLLYNAMFIPYVFQGDYGINPGSEERLIDKFLRLNFNKNNVWYNRDRKD